MLHMTGSPDAKPRHVPCKGAPEALLGSAGAGRLCGEVVCVDVVNKCRGGKNGWHGDTPCPRMRAHKLWGLPPAEHPVRRHWRSVEGETVLNHHFKKSISHEIAKVKLIVFIDGRKKSNI